MPDNAAPALRAEFVLIGAMLRGDGACTQRAARDISDWPHAIDTIVQHEVLPLLAANIKYIPEGAIPETVLLRLKILLHTNALNNVYLAHQLISLLQVFPAQHIRALPFKGPTLAMQAYGELGLRQFIDLDLLVADEDFQRASQVLLSQNFSLLHQLEWESHFVSSDTGVAVDLHKGITPEFFPFPVSFQDTWANQRNIKLCGEQIGTLSTEDLLLVLAVTLARDVHDNRLKLKQICDVAALLRAELRMDWDYVLRQAHAKGVERLLFLALTMAERICAVELPESVVHRIRCNPKLDELVRQVEAQLYGSGSLPLRRDKIRFHSKLRERLCDRMAYHTDLLCKPSLLVQKLFVPNERDWNFVRLPKFASPLYLIIKPLRLLIDRIHPRLTS